MTEDYMRKPGETAYKGRLRGIFDESPVGILIYDAQGTLLEANERFMEIFGF
jgi:PAS domain S-box-containing protein